MYCFLIRVLIAACATSGGYFLSSEINFVEGNEIEGCDTNDDAREGDEIVLTRVH